jgi:molecular chaperone DnaK (HSP70)
MENVPCAIGIDVGTSFTRVAVWRNGKVNLIASLPSYVSFDYDECFVGETALVSYYKNSQITFSAQTYNKSRKYIF